MSPKIDVVEMACPFCGRELVGSSPSAGEPAALACICGLALEVRVIRLPHVFVDSEALGKAVDAVIRHNEEGK